MGFPTELTFSINPLGRFDFPVHTAVEDDQFGQVLVAVNGSVEGQINAGVSFYRIDSSGLLEQKVHTQCTKGNPSLLSGIIP